MFELSAGQIIADKYRVDAVIGAGGMGVVVAATHIELGQRVAIKLLRDATSEALARFKREARLLVKLRSQHVARVFDVGALDDETPYIVMELLEGQDLSSLLTARGRLRVDEAVDYVLEAAEAVAEAHVLGMVHRDLKPANVFLARGPGGAETVKVLDFGVSKMLDAKMESEQTTGGLTNEGVALGSPGYMAPEQMTSSRDVDARADIYSLGAMLYRLVSGQNPYKGSSLVSVLAAMAIDPLPPLKTLVPDAPDGFAAAVERCLAQDRDQRWPTVAHLAHALAPFGSRRGRDSAQQILATMNVAIEPFAATIVRPALPSTPPGRSSSVSGLAPPPPPERDRAWMMPAAAAVFVLAIAIAGAAWYATRARADTTTVPTPVTSATTEVAPPPTATSPGGLLGASPTPDAPPSAIEPAPIAPRASTSTRPTTTSRPRPHGTGHGPSLAPPSPTDVPDGRH